MNPVERCLRDGHIVGLANHTVLMRNDGREFAIGDSAAPIRDRDRTLVGNINDIGHLLGKHTIAEYAEDEATLAVLNELGVDYAQGYGISKPQPLEIVWPGADGLPLPASARPMAIFSTGPLASIEKRCYEWRVFGPIVG